MLDGLQQERRENEEVVASMSEGEREELFERMNKMERSRIINLAERHCQAMMDLIHRWVGQGGVGGVVGGVTG